MLVNVTKAPLVVGRFRILPGDKVPALAMTAKEEAGIARMKERGFLQEKTGMHKSEVVPQKAPEVKPAAEEKPSKKEKEKAD